MPHRSRPSVSCGLRRSVPGFPPRSASVSYTHLDVYKRQEQYVFNIYFFEHIVEFYGLRIAFILMINNPSSGQARACSSWYKNTNYLFRVCRIWCNFIASVISCFIRVNPDLDFIINPGILENIILQTTADGSHTLFLPGLNEHYHSTHGAIQESELVFIHNGLHHISPDVHELSLIHI